MKQKHIGRILFEVRTNQKLEQKKLCQGLCTYKDLSRYEKGGGTPNIFLIHALLQRMGMSAGKLELFASEEEIHMMELRYALEDAIQNREFDSCTEKLASLEKVIATDKILRKQTLHKQFILKMKSLIAYFQGQDTRMAMKYAREAFVTTCNQEELAWEQGLHLEELFIMLMICYYHMELEEEEQGFQMLQKMKSYIENKIKDMEERVKIYPQVIFVLVKYLDKKEAYLEMRSCCKAGIALQRMDGKLFLLPELMRFQKKSARYLKKQEEQEELHTQISVLEEVLYENGYDTTLKEEKLFINKYRDMIYSIAKIVRKNRERLGESQEEFSNEVCSVESLSRIERGLQVPKASMYEELQEEMMHKHELRSPLLDIDDFEILEKKKKIERLSTIREYEEMEETFLVFKREIDEESPKNKQYLLFMETICGIDMHRIEKDVAIEQLEKALDYTLKEFRLADISKMYLIGLEIHILLCISSIYYAMNQRKKGLDILEAILENLEKNSSSTCSYFNFCIPIRVNRTKYLEETDALHESVEACEEVIRIMLNGYNIRVVDELLANRAFALRRIDKEASNNEHLELCKKGYRQAFHISHILEHQQVAKIIKRIYLERYGEEIV